MFYPNYRVEKLCFRVIVGYGVVFLYNRYKQALVSDC